MIYEISSRRSGKTTRMVALVKADPQAVLLVFTNEDKIRIHDEHKLPLKRIVTLQEVEDGFALLSLPTRPLFIDNADLMLKWYLTKKSNYRLAGLSMSGDE